jgi:hypothetical protein
MRRQLSYHAGGTSAESSKDWHLESGPLRVLRHLVPARKRRCRDRGWHLRRLRRSKGAPIRAIGNQTTGAHALYWYALADSPRSSINMIVLALIKQFGSGRGHNAGYEAAGSQT